MFADDQYTLLDWGNGRKLERFGEICLDRPAPAAEGSAVANPQLWQRAAARYRRGKGADGTWTPAKVVSDSEQWAVVHGRLQLELKLTPFGHVGVFPEQAKNWDWIDHVLARTGRPVRLINLFAYTGGSSLAAAAAGAEVVHVDASRPVVTWARANAAMSELESAPIRWICEDARKFVEREVRRERLYDGLILDPPSYGHGPKRQVWRLDDDLAPLLRSVAPLLGASPELLVCTCHSPGWGPRELRRLVADAVPQIAHSAIEADHLALQTADGRALPCGAVARWSRSGS